ncbi:MAG: disulfide bond formation protein B [Gammaproteobacteria bacterium]|nr:MAG: disulfide bond formation protein B [Gammaproteobacteria bacterium]
MFFSRRSCNVMAMIGCLVLIAVAYFYMENYLFLNPCPLCYAQRIVFAFLGLFFLLAAIFPGKTWGRKTHAVILLLTAAGGAALSIRHLYLQNLPKGQVPACGQDFYALVQNTPFAEAVKTMLTGTGDCAEVQWTMLGLSIPGWTLIAFIGFAIWGFVHNWFRVH